MGPGAEGSRLEAGARAWVPETKLGDIQHSHGELYVLCVCVVGERQRERETETDRETYTQRGIETERQRDTETQRDWRNVANPRL